MFQVAAWYRMHIQQDFSVYTNRYKTVKKQLTSKCGMPNLLASQGWSACLRGYRSQWSPKLGNKVCLGTRTPLSSVHQPDLWGKYRTHHGILGDEHQQMFSCPEVFHLLSFQESTQPPDINFMHQQISLIYESIYTHFFWNQQMWWTPCRNLMMW